MKASVSQMYDFYFLGMQPKNMDKILRFVDKYATSVKNRKFKSLDGDLIMNINLEEPKNGISNMVCFVDKEIAKSFE